MDKIICVGKNYLEHAKELGDAIPKKPILFLKPPSVLKIAQDGQPLLARLPEGRGPVHFECEIVFRIRCKAGTTPYFDALTLGLDMTIREAQTELKRQGHPWELAKVFTDSALLGAWKPIKDIPDYLNKEFSCEIEGQLRQKATGSQMTLSPEICRAYAQECFPLCDGDLLFTGTPAGVGPVTKGQSATLLWEGESLLQVHWE
ncbi:fumarylacetoacetate hydrolase family protein [Bdellovibrionota bacterium FG-2]